MTRKTGLFAAALFAGAMACMGCGDNNKTDGSVNGSETAEAEVFDYSIDDYVKLGEYKQLSVKYPVPVITEEDVETSIEEMLDEHTEYKEISDRPAQNNDYVNLDFKGTVDGEEFDGGTAEDYEFTLGQEEFIEEFEANVVGKSAGETFTFQMTFPDDYDEDLKGKTAEFTVTLNSINEVQTPEYTDDFVKEATEYETIDAYEEALREELLLSAQQEAESAAGDDALLQAVSNAEIDGYPQALYDSCYNDTVEQYQSYADMFGVDFDEFMSDYMEDGDLEAETLNWVNEILVSQAIAKAEGFEITDKNYKEEAEALAVEYEYESLEDFVGDYGELSVMAMLVRGKAVAFLYENANVEEVSEEEYYEEDEYDDDSAPEDGTEAVFVEEGTEEDTE